MDTLGDSHKPLTLFHDWNNSIDLFSLSGCLDMTEFFNSSNLKGAINGYINFINSKNENSEFKTSRNKYLIVILNSMREHPNEWDAYTKLGIKDIGTFFIRDLINQDPHDDEINYVLSTLFRFLLEFRFNQHDELSADLESAKLFIIKYRDEFSERAFSRIDYSLAIMPFELLRNEYQSEDVQYFKKAIESEKSMRERIENWDEKLERKIEKVEALKTKLDEQENAFNFVGLYLGFDGLSKEKKTESKRAFWFTLLLGFLVLLPFSVDIFLIYKKVVTLDSILSLFQLIPAFTLTFIFIYYFRISLSNYISIKAQVNQIELRKTLCSFIQKYSEYAKEMKTNDWNSLEKFETIIFSNIMTSEDKIPSTFDGIEQIAKLITSMKGK
ncbi:hypothetical protein [Pectobacterium carotovorum]|uniref:hypothetical protein n=1 Tax=Pectobacterium carotovorum TaxID=554 RepID=UPI00301A27C5